MGAAQLGPDWRLRLFAALGPVGLMESQLMIAFVFAACAATRRRGRRRRDREWLARLSAVRSSR